MKGGYLEMQVSLRSEFSFVFYVCSHCLPLFVLSRVALDHHAAAAQAAKRVSHDHECNGFGEACTVELKDGFLREVSARRSDLLVVLEVVFSDSKCYLSLGVFGTSLTWRRQCQLMALG